MTTRTGDFMHEVDVRWRDLRIVGDVNVAVAAEGEMAVPCAGAQPEWQEESRSWEVDFNNLWIYFGDEQLRLAEWDFLPASLRKIVGESGIAEKAEELELEP